MPVQIRNEINIPLKIMNAYCDPLQLVAILVCADNHVPTEGQDLKLTNTYLQDRLFDTHTWHSRTTDSHIFKVVERRVR